jgi:hypothetical protein
MESGCRNYKFNWRYGGSLSKNGGHLLMVKTNKKIILHQLDSELGNVGLNATELNGEFEIHYADGRDDDKALLDAISAHIPTENSEPTIEEKLASVGLNLNDLKTALGLA